MTRIVKQSQAPRNREKAKSAGRQNAPVIKWTGSKRSQATFIVCHFPSRFDTYFEPFVGGGSVLFEAKPYQAIAGDICEPLIALWRLIQTDPDRLIDHYTYHWNRLKDQGHLVFYEVRDRFNSEHNPCDLFFLSRTCVNGLIRFNSKGEFNNSLHHTRRGIQPTRVASIILEWGRQLAQVEFRVGDYRETTRDATSRDLIYLDPPYFHTKGRYYGKIDYEEFQSFLESLSAKGVRYILSYDGRRGNRTYETPLPTSLYKRKYLVPSGNSPFRKVMEKEKELVEETLYLNW